MSQSDPYASFESYRPQPPAGQPWTPQQPAWGGPPPRQPKRKHTLRNVLLGIGAAFVLLIAISVAASGGGASSTQSASSSTPASSGGAAPAAVPAPGIGQPARDGDFVFTVQSFTCGASAAAAVAGSDGFGETVPAGSVECIATMTVTDDKGQAQTFMDSAQYAYDAAGRQFSADDNASVYLAGDKDVTQLNPGVTITAAVPFQMSAGTRIVRLVLHDSDFSDGVTVKVG